MNKINELILHSKREAVWSSIWCPLTNSVRDSVNEFAGKTLHEPIFNIVRNSLLDPIIINAYNVIRQYE